GLQVPEEAGDAAGVEDAVPVGAAGGAAFEQSMAPERATCQSHGRAAGLAGAPDPRRQGGAEGGGERRLRANPASRDCPTAAEILFLYLGRGGLDRPLDVLLGHDRRGRAGFRPGYRAGTPVAIFRRASPPSA